MHPIPLPAIIKEIGRGAKGARDLSRDAAESLCLAMLHGQVPDLELGAILIALRIKGESDDELLGFTRAMQATTVQLHSLSQPLVVLPSYNGVRRQPNLLPLLAILLQRAGFAVLIHGYHDFNQRENPFPLFQACGIPQATSLDHAQHLLAQTGLAAIHLAQLNPGLNQLLRLRTRLGVRNTGHTLCKLLDPCAGHSIRVVNVTHPEYLARLTPLLVAQQGTALLMRGTEGEAFANPKRRPELIGFQKGQQHVIYPAQEGIAPPIDGWPDSADPVQNTQLINALLNDPTRIPEPLRDQVSALQRLAGRNL